MAAKKRLTKKQAGPLTAFVESDTKTKSEIMEGVVDKAIKAQKKLTAKQAGVKHGWRSGLEELVGKQLDDLGVAYEYEKLTIHYTIPARKAKYTPDFEILSNGIIVETKGRFVTADRQKHLMIKEQHPNLDIRFVFSNPKQRISKLSQTTYAMWCDKHGFKWAAKTVPDDWIKEQK